MVRDTSLSHTNKLMFDSIQDKNFLRNTGAFCISETETRNNIVHSPKNLKYNNST
jgi:hypothetical protein